MTVSKNITNVSHVDSVIVTNNTNISSMNQNENYCYTKTCQIVTVAIVSMNYTSTRINYWDLQLRTFIKTIQILLLACDAESKKKLIVNAA